MAFTNLNLQAKKLAAGSGHSLAIDTDGRLYSWGLNDNGQLGQGDLENRVSPEQVGTDTGWTHIACGSKHSLAIRNGILWGFGNNNSMQCSSYNNRSTNLFNTPTQISLDNETIHEVWAASDYTIVRSDNSDSVYRQFGRISEPFLYGFNNAQPYRSSTYNWITFDGARAGLSLTHLALGNRGIVGYTGQKYMVSGLGKDFNTGYKSEGAVYRTAYYNGVAGFWGPGPTRFITDTNSGTDISPRPQSIAVGRNFVIIVGVDRNVYAYSFPETSQTTINKTTAESLMQQCAIGVKGWNATKVCHYLENITPTEYSGIFEHVEAGQDHAILRDVNGYMYGIGSNVRGQLGINSSGGNITEITRMDIPPANSSSWEVMACGDYHTLISLDE